jgi:hypothetical protein
MLAREPADRPQDLREVLVTLRPFARLDAAEFGPPSRLPAQPAGSRLASDPVRSEVDEAGMDPANPTEWSPADDTAAPQTIPAGARNDPRKNLAWLGAGAVVLVILVTWLASASRNGKATPAAPSGVAGERPDLAGGVALAEHATAKAGWTVAVPTASATPEPVPPIVATVRPNPLPRAAGSRHLEGSGSATAGKPAPPTSGTPPPTVSTRAPTKPPGLRSEDGLVDDPPY